MRFFELIWTKRLHYSRIPKAILYLWLFASVLHLFHSIIQQVAQLLGLHRHVRHVKMLLRNTDAQIPSSRDARRGCGCQGL